MQKSNVGAISSKNKCNLVTRVGAISLFSVMVIGDLQQYCGIRIAELKRAGTFLLSRFVADFLDLLTNPTGRTERCPR